MCADFNIHNTGNGNPHAHILLTMRPMDAQGKWLPKSKKEYVLDENGERIRLPSGRYKTRKVDLVDWNNRENAEVWRRAWADLANEFLAQNNRPERIDHRSYERQGIDQIPTVHIGVTASQMEKKGIATERGELNRSIKAANRLLRDIKAQIGKLKELKVPEKMFTAFLIRKRYLYRAPSGSLMPYVKAADDGLFFVKDYIAVNGHQGVYTLVTPKGKALFLSMLGEIA